MNNKGIAKIAIVIGIFIIILIIGVIYFKVLKESSNFTCFKGKGSQSLNNTLIGSKKDLNKIIKQGQIGEEISNIKTFEKVNLKEYFNEQYFENKKMAVLVLYEDTSKEYICSVDKLTYNSDRTEAIIEYTYKSDGYGGMLTNTWYDYFIVEVDSSVKNVNFVKSTQ